MKEIASFSHTDSDDCTGNCKGCGKTHIKIFGNLSASTRLLSERVRLALASNAMEGKVKEIADPVDIEANGLIALPALMVEGELVLQGVVPSVGEIARILKNKDLLKSKLFKLHTLSVPVDMSDVSANALAFAWKITKKLDCNLEIVYAMDSIFEGSTPSATGFLSGYTKTMHTELDAFIREKMEFLGVKYEDRAQIDAGPGQFAEQKTDASRITSRVIYGAPDVAIAAYSRSTDLLVMGATGRGGLAKKLFGSVSAEVSRNAHCPVLFVSQETQFGGFENILYAADFDSISTLSVNQTISFAKRFDGQMHFVHVGPGGEKGMEEQRERFEAMFVDSGYNKPFIFSRMVGDDILGGLYEYAFYHRIELLVFVTHHRAFWGNILHKSITNEALSTSELPLLVIHSDDDML